MNLRELAHEVIDQSKSDDLGEMVEDLLARIEDGDLRDALRQTLRAFLREVLRAERNVSEQDQPVIAAPTIKKTPQNQSWWMSAIRARYHVGGGAWKKLGAMTYEDLIFAAQERRDIAKKNERKADELDALAELIKRYNVETVNDLPKDVLSTVLGDEDDLAG